MAKDIDPKLWREAMGGFLTGVTIVTTHKEDGRPAGTAVNAFCALSLSPPLLLVCLDTGSRTLRDLKTAGTFCVNILSDRQEGFVRRFADKDEADRFKDVAYTLTKAGDPALAESVAWFDCAVHELLAGGDHQIVVGRVTTLGSDAEAAPLAYHRGKLRPLPSSSYAKGSSA